MSVLKQGAFYIVLLLSSLQAVQAEQSTNVLEVKDKCGRLQKLNLEGMKELSAADILSRLKAVARQPCAPPDRTLLVKTPLPAPARRESDAAASPATSTSQDDTPRTIFIARDRFNMLGQMAAPSAYTVSTSPLGATLSPSDDLRKNQQTISAQTYLSWYAWGNKDNSPEPPVTFGIGPAITLDGNYSKPVPNPIPATGSPSLNSIRLGPDLQFGAHGGNNYLYGAIAPFYQTDFAGTARISGTDFQLEPYIPAISLGAAAPPSVPNSPPRVVGFVWRLAPEMQFVDVSRPGQTNYVDGRYAWTGANVQTTISLFPDDNGKSQSFLDRISATIGYRYFVDVMHSGSTLKQFQAELDYKLPPFVPGNNPNGIPTIGLQYIEGSDIETLQIARQIKAQFSYKY